MDNLSDLLGIRNIDRILNARKRKLCEVKGVDERINKGVCRWLTMWREWRMIGLKRESVGECAGSSSVGWPRRRWVHIVKECLKTKEVWMSDKQGERCRIGVNGGVCEGTWESQQCYIVFSHEC